MSVIESETIDQEIGYADPDFRIEDQLLDHLAVSDSAMRLFRERFSEELVSDREPELRKLIRFVFDYIDSNKIPPTTEVLEYETGIQFESPKCEIGWLINKFRDRYKRNKTKEVLIKASRKASVAPDEALSLAVTNLNELQAITSPRRHELSTRDWGVRLEAYQKKALEGKLTGYTFGWDEVDQYIGGLKIGEVAYVIGRPKRKKSFFLLKSAFETTMHPVNPGKAVLFSLEMSEEVMYDRYMAMVAGINYGKMVDGRLSLEEYETLAQIEEEVRDWDESRSLVIASPPSGQRTVQALRQYALDLGADVVYIDQLSFLRSTRSVPADKRHIEVEYINEDLREAATDFPIYIAAQFNREAASMGEMADLSKIGLSDSIGQKADILLGLYQNKDMQQNNIIEFGVIDARNYGIHRWEINTDFTRTSFTVAHKKEDF